METKIKNVKKIKEIYICDFETISENTNFFKKWNDVRVNLFYIKKFKEDIEYLGVNIEQFWDTLKTIKTGSLFYFHNLSFDGDFIWKFLIKNGYQRVNDISRNCKSFKTINVGNKLYEIKVKFKQNMGTYYTWRLHTFRCSYTLLSASVERLGEDFNLSKSSFLENDKKFYNVEPKQTIEELPPKYIEYCKNDVKIIELSLIEFQKSLNVLSKKFAKSFALRFDKKLTIGSLSFSIQKRYLHKFNKENNTDIDIFTYSHTDFKIASKFFSGGFTQFNPNIQNKLINVNGVGIDVVSMYPSIMYGALPYGKIYNFKNDTPDKTKKYVIFTERKIEFAYANNPEVICLKNWGKTTARYVSHLRNFTCYYFEKEWNTLNKFYTFKNVKIINSYFVYVENYLKEFVTDIFNYKTIAKQNKQLGMKQSYKTLLNAGYGKHATREKYEMEYMTNDILDPGDLFNTKRFSKDIELKVLRDGSHQNYYRSYIMINNETPDKFYNKILAAYVTSFARVKLLETINNYGVKNFLYCDTDSIYLNSKINLDKVDIGEKLGQWEIEKEFTQFKVKGAKAYAFGDNDNIKGFRYSGINGKWLKENLTYDLFDNVNIELIKANLKPIYYPSGILLRESNYTPTKRGL